MTARARAWAWPAFLAGAAVLYALARRAYYVGFFNDDAFYLIGARSLLQGRYAELNAPGQPPLVNYLPGYPLLLTPVLWVSRGSWLACQCYSAALLLGSVWLLRELYREELSPAALWAAVLVAALNPLAVSMSGTILSDVPFLFLAALTLCLARAVWEDEAPARWAGLAVLTGFSALVRPTGAALGAGLVLALALERRWRIAVLFGFLAALPAGAFLLRNHLRAGHSLMYFIEFTEPYRRGAAPFAALGANLAFYLRFLFVTTLFRWPSSPVLDAATIGLCLAAVGCGLRDLGARGWRKAGPLFLLVFFSAHLLWSKQAGRYLLPVVPFAAAYLFHGLSRFGDRAVLAVLGLSLCLCAGPDARIVRASLWERTPVTTPPERTFDWIRRNTPPDAVFAAELDGRFYLRTGRPVVHLRRIFDAGEFRRWLAENGVRYVLVSADGSTLRTASGRGSNDPMPVPELRALLAGGPGGAPVFEDPDEGSEVYRVENIVKSKDKF